MIKRIGLRDGTFILIDGEHMTLDQIEDKHAETRIYFLQCQTTKLIKIGISIDVSLRIAEIQSMCPTQLVLLSSLSGSRWVEVELHRLFEDARKHGEWFSPVPELLSLIGSGTANKERVKAATPLADLMVVTGLNERECRRAIDAGQLPGYKEGRTYFVPEFELTAFCHGRWRPSVRDES